jgi:hypothetical protein
LKTHKEAVVIKSNLMRLVGAALVASIALLGASVSASAGTFHPTKSYVKMTECPLEQIPYVELCSWAESTSGVFQVGTIDTPVNTPIVLQIGLHENQSTGVLEVVGAANGETISKSPQVIPGGLFSLVREGRYPGYLRRFCQNFPNNSECKATGTAELAGPASNIHLNTTNLIFEEGTALEVPIKLHIKNPFLGGKCYVGSDSDPIIVKYTTGTTSPPPPNTPIKGSAGSLEIAEEGNFVRLQGGTLADNSFAAPGAEGCGGPQSVIVDKEINTKDHLPSPAGSNTSTLSGELQEAVAVAVRESEV